MRCRLPHLVTLIYTYELLLVQKYPNSKLAILSPSGIALCLCYKLVAHPFCQDGAVFGPQSGFLQGDGAPSTSRGSVTVRQSRPRSTFSISCTALRQSANLPTEHACLGGRGIPRQGSTQMRLMALMCHTGRDAEGAEYLLGKVRCCASTTPEGFQACHDEFCMQLAALRIAGKGA